MWVRLTRLSNSNKGKEEWKMWTGRGSLGWLVGLEKEHRGCGLLEIRNWGAFCFALKYYAREGARVYESCSPCLLITDLRDIDSTSPSRAAFPVMLSHGASKAISSFLWESTQSRAFSPAPVFHRTTHLFGVVIESYDSSLNVHRHIFFTRLGNQFWYSR